jgi:hypothetical protein
MYASVMTVIPFAVVVGYFVVFVAGCGYKK